MFGDGFGSDASTSTGACSGSVELVVVFPVFDGAVVSFVGSETVFGLGRSELRGVQRDDKSEDVDFDVSGLESEDGFASGRAFAVSKVGSGSAGCLFSGATAGDSACSAVMPVSILILTRDFCGRTREVLLCKFECLQVELID